MKKLQHAIEISFITIILMNQMLRARIRNFSQLGFLYYVIHIMSKHPNMNIKYIFKKYSFMKSCVTVKAF